jgi:hypothetical protein
MVQAGAAIEELVHEGAHLAVDTHGYTDLAMALARGVDLGLGPTTQGLERPGTP